MAWMSTASHRVRSPMSKVDSQTVLSQLDGRAVDVVDQHVQRALFGVDPLHQFADLGCLQMVHTDRDPVPARFVDERRRLLDRLRTIRFRPPGTGTAAGHVNGRPGGTQLDRYSRPAPRVAPATNAILSANGFSTV